MSMPDIRCFKPIHHDHFFIGIYNYSVCLIKLWRSSRTCVSYFVLLKSQWMNFILTNTSVVLSGEISTKQTELTATIIPITLPTLTASLVTKHSSSCTIGPKLFCPKPIVVKGTLSCECTCMHFSAKIYASIFAETQWISQEKYILKNP